MLQSIVLSFVGSVNHFGKADRAMPKPQLVSCADVVNKRFEDLVKRGVRYNSDLRNGSPKEAVGASEHINGATKRSHGASEHMDDAPEQIDGASERIGCVTEQDHPGAGSEFRGFKGFGKGNFGSVLPKPSSDALSSNASSPIPYARFPESSEVELWINEHFEKLSTREERRPRKGDVVLWRGFKRGRHGGASTAVEYFRGEIHEIIEDGKETFYSVS